METKLITMTLAEEFFRFEPQAITSWLRVFRKMSHAEAEGEAERIMASLAERELAPEDAALVGGIIEDSCSTFSVQFLGRHNGYTCKEALGTYTGVIADLYKMADGLWEGHVIKWTSGQVARAQAQLEEIKQAKEKAA